MEQKNAKSPHDGLSSPRPQHLLSALPLLMKSRAPPAKQRN